MFRSLRSKLMSRGSDSESESVLADTSPFQPVHISTSEPALRSSSKPAKPMSGDDEYVANKHREECGRFRILIIGRANAGKTTILQKVCNTTEKPVIYNSKGKKVSITGEVGLRLMTVRLRSDQVIASAALGRGTLSQLVSDVDLKLDQRGLHDITNEMVFESNPGFIFHDSRGFEAGGVAEFENVKAFIAKRAQSEELRDQVHAIWYVIRL
jgi:hypothetical protein